MDLLGGWFNYNSKSIAPPEQTPLQTIRSKQIAQLRTIPYRVIEIRKECEYQVTINELSGFSLILVFPAFFPQERLTAKVSHPIRHPWVDDNLCIVNCPQINNFVVQSNLGRVVLEVIDELGQVHAQTQLCSQSIPSTYTSSSSSHPVFMTSGGSRQIPPPSNYSPLVSNNLNASTQPSPRTDFSSYDPAKLPRTHEALLNLRDVHLSTSPVYSTFYNSPIQTLPVACSSQRLVGSVQVRNDSVERLSGDSQQKNFKIEITSVQELDKLKTEEALQILNEEDKLEELVMSIHGKQIQSYQSKRDNMAQCLEEFARFNLDLKKQLEEKKAAFDEKCNERKKLVGKLESSLREIDEKSKKILNSETMLDKMKSAVLQAEDGADSCVESFIGRKIPVDEFLKVFIGQRKLFHSRSVKMERIHDPNSYGLPI